MAVGVWVRHQDQCALCPDTALNACGRKDDAAPHTLVPSDRVKGVPVYGSDGTKIGSIERLMLDKRTGLVAYAVVKNRGWFGAGQHYYPLSWGTLKFNPGRAAYEADVTLEALRSGPSELDVRLGRSLPALSVSALLGRVAHQVKLQNWRNPDRSRSAESDIRVSIGERLNRGKC